MLPETSSNDKPIAKRGAGSSGLKAELIWRGTIIYRTTRVNERIKTMDIQEEIKSELVRLDVPLTSLGGFQFDSSEEPKEVKVDYEGVTGTFDPEDLLSLLKILPDQAGSIVVVEALRISPDRR
jgi:hypothetical protein